MCVSVRDSERLVPTFGRKVFYTCMEHATTFGWSAQKVCSKLCIKFCARAEPREFTSCPGLTNLMSAEEDCYIVYCYYVMLLTYNYFSLSCYTNKEYSCDSTNGDEQVRTFNRNLVYSLMVRTI